MRIRFVATLATIAFCILSVQSTTTFCTPDKADQKFSIDKNWPSVKCCPNDRKPISCFTYNKNTQKCKCFIFAHAETVRWCKWGDKEQMTRIGTEQEYHATCDIHVKQECKNTTDITDLAGKDMACLPEKASYPDKLKLKCDQDHKYTLTTLPTCQFPICRPRFQKLRFYKTCMPILNHLPAILGFVHKPKDLCKPYELPRNHTVASRSHTGFPDHSCAFLPICGKNGKVDTRKTFAVWSKKDRPDKVDLSKCEMLCSRSRNDGVNCRRRPSCLGHSTLPPGFYNPTGIDEDHCVPWCLDPEMKDCNRIPRCVVRHSEKANDKTKNSTFTGKTPDPFMKMNPFGSRKCISNDNKLWKDVDEDENDQEIYDSGMQTLGIYVFLLGTIIFFVGTLYIRNDVDDDSFEDEASSNNSPIPRGLTARMSTDDADAVKLLSREGRVNVEELDYVLRNDGSMKHKILGSAERLKASNRERGAQRNLMKNLKEILKETELEVTQKSAETITRPSKPSTNRTLPTSLAGTLTRHSAERDTVVKHNKKEVQQSPAKTAKGGQGSDKPKIPPPQSNKKELAARHSNSDKETQQTASDKTFSDANTTLLSKHAKDHKG